MELQKLIDGLRNHRNGAASYESVNEAIRVFEAMRDVDVEKVRKGLSCHVYGHPHTRCHKCPYWGTGPHGSSECSVLAADALSLIRAQQARIKELEAAQTARIMTITEAQDAEVAWLERYADPDDGVEPIIQPVIVKYYENEHWQCLIVQNESPDLTFFIEDYNTEFRFWTARPTDERRRATPWE